MQAYFNELDGVTLADIAGPPLASPRADARSGSARAAQAAPMRSPVTRRKALAKAAA
jgi:hypothetical protein